MKATIKKRFTPHDGQKNIVENAARFNVINCGRRFGKTVLARYLLTMPALQGYPTAFFAPTYKDMAEVWRFVKKTVTRAGLVQEKSEQLKQLVLKTGGIIDFWSLDDVDSGRGRRYKRVIVDEVAKVRNFKDAWEQTLRPTMADFQGDAFLFSTPKGKDNFWYDLCNMEGEEWSYFHMPTESNPYIPKSEIEAAKTSLPAKVFQQEYLADFVDFNELPFFYEFDESKHVGGTGNIDAFEPLWISFDFNIDPTTAIIGQKIPGKGCFVHDVLQIPGGTWKMCQELKIFSSHRAGLFVTGDYSGNTGNTAAGELSGGGYNTDFEIIKKELMLSPRQLINTYKANKHHTYSRGIVNRALFRIGDNFKINPDCKSLIYDLRTGKADKNSRLVKDRQNNKQDAGDAFRYLIDAWFLNGDKDITNFAEKIF